MLMGTWEASIKYWTHEDRGLCRTTFYNWWSSGLYYSSEIYYSIW